MDACISEAGEGIEEMFKQDKFTGDLGGEAVLPAASAQQHSHSLCSEAGREVWGLLKEEG